MQDILIRSGSDKFPIDRHAYFQALVKGNGKLYEKQINKSPHQKRKKSGSWKEFLKLKNNIQDNGFKPHKSPMLIKFPQDESPYVTHGRHRITLLRHIYGPKSVLTVKLRDGTRYGEVMKVSKGKTSGKMREVPKNGERVKLPKAKTLGKGKDVQKHGLVTIQKRKS